MTRTLIAIALFSTLLGAQHRGIGAGRIGPGSGSRSIGARSGHLSYGGVYYRPDFYGSYGSYGYGPQLFGAYFQPFTQVFAPQPQSANGGPMVVIVQAPPQQEDRVVYVPSWMRPNPGPSLGEIARQIGAKPHKHPVDKTID